MIKLWFFLIFFASHCASETDNSQHEIKGYYSSQALWSFTDLKVCWENSSLQTQQEELWVKTRIQETWQQQSNLTFHTWQPCSSLAHAHIRILIADEPSHTKGLGKELDGIDEGMLLNFSFKQWNRQCLESEAKRRLCIETIAMHEFGHAIGLAHEHNRSDRPQDCTVTQQGELEGTVVGLFDVDSIMNYCYRSSFNNHLSAGDIATVRIMYPKVVSGKEEGLGENFFE